MLLSRKYEMILLGCCLLFTSCLLLHALIAYSKNADAGRGFIPSQDTI